MIAPRRFWTEVTIEPEGGDFGLRLDARPLRTPAKAPLRVPTRALAEAVAAEWRAIAEEIDPAALPFTRAVNAAIDRVARDPAPVIDAVAAYGATDLVCYRAEAPEGLRLRQAAGWDPLIAWSAAALGAPLLTTFGVIHVAQPPASLEAMRAAVASGDAFALTALAELVALAGSLVIGLAVARGARTAKAAWDLSRIDEIWQADQWGSDDEAETSAALRRNDFLRAAHLLEMLAEPGLSVHKA